LLNNKDYIARCTEEIAKIDAKYGVGDEGSSLAFYSNLGGVEKAPKPRKVFSVRSGSKQNSRQ